MRSADKEQPFGQAECWNTRSLNSAASVSQLQKLTSDALLLEIETPRTDKESVDLFRIGKAEVEANSDGIDFSGPMFETLHLVGAMTREASLDRTSSVYAQGKQAVPERRRAVR